MDRKWWTLIAVSVAIFMLLLDITVVNVALPSIQHDLHSSFSDLQWVVNAYALTLAALLLTSGSLADLFGRRRIFAAGLVVFTCSSAICGLSSSPLMLNLARAVHSYRIGFTEAFTTILVIAAAIAFTGALLAFLLVRSRDFVNSAVPAAEAPASEPVGAAAG